MDFFGGLNEVSEASEMKEMESYDISRESNEKFDKLMGDDNLREETSKQQDNRPELSPAERKNKFDKLFDSGNFFERDIVQSDIASSLTDKLVDIKENMDEKSAKSEGEALQDPECYEKRESNSTYEFNGDTYETDDDGQTYKKNGKIYPNTEYTVNGNTYITDKNGNKISCDSTPEYTEEGSRNVKEQKESGGEERQEDDDGGHIIARILGGAEGEENLVPMRRTINRGDYKKMENEIAKALKDDKKVIMHIDLEYDGNSQRPSKIRADYISDGKKTVVKFDNEEFSTELLNSLNDKIGDEDYNNLKEEIEDMEADGAEASVTSIKVEYDESGNSTKVTVGILDESTGQKSYKVYNPRQEE